MSDSSSQYSTMSDAELEKIRNLAAVDYLHANLHLMMRALKMEDYSFKAVHKMAMPMVEPLNLATYSTWCALMHDQSGMQITLDKLIKEIKEVGGFK